MILECVRVSRFCILRPWRPSERRCPWTLPRRLGLHTSPFSPQLPSSADAAAHAQAARCTSPCRQPRVCVQTWCRSWFRSTATAADPASATTSIAAVAATVASLAVSACACATAPVAMASAPNHRLATHAFIGLRRHPHQAVGVPATVPSARAALARATLATRQRLLPAAQSSGDLDPELQ
jgi:hypothetical protein